MRAATGQWAMFLDVDDVLPSMPSTACLRLRCDTAAMW
ncbi:MAG: hypothetical protein ACLSUZ_01200 [Bifidobacterium pseudocatenulatum]